MGRLTQTVTLGDFDRDDVVEAFEEPPERSGHSLFENGERDDRGDVAVLSDGNVAAAVTDGVLVAGLEPVVRASIDAADGDAESYLDADPVRNDIVRKLDDPSFFSVGSHERREETDLETGTFAGQVARGDGYRFTGDGPEAKIVRVFDDDAIDVDAVETWADEALDRVPDLDVRTEDRTVIVEGRADTDALPFTTGAFLPFSYAAATVSR